MNRGAPSAVSLEMEHHAGGHNHQNPFADGSSGLNSAMASGRNTPMAGMAGRSTPVSTNPFATPIQSRAPSTIGNSSIRGRTSIGGRHRFFHSRRIQKDWDEKPPVFEKNPGEKWLWIIPVMGLVVGLAITGVLIFMTAYNKTSYNYCPILDEDFSSGTLNPKVWQKEIEVGGFGNKQFEMTTADAENLFIQDGKLHIKPTLQDEKLITGDNIIDLRANGACTSSYWANCVTSTNTTNGTIIQPVKSARINTKVGARIKYGRVEVTAKIPKGDWLWPAIWMLPVEETYGPWPLSGEIDILEARGNNHTYSPGGNNIAGSALHWGPDAANDAWRLTNNHQHALHSEFGDAFHVFGMEWSEKYLFTYIDTQLLQVFYWDFKQAFWPQGGFPLADANGTRFVDPWSLSGRANTPFDQEFYLILNVAVGGENGWFPDGRDGKPWVDGGPSAKADFWNARDKWFPTWQKQGEMVVERVKMWQQC